MGGSAWGAPFGGFVGLICRFDFADDWGIGDVERDLGDVPRAPLLFRSLLLLLIWSALRCVNQPFNARFTWSGMSILFL